MERERLTRLLDGPGRMAREDLRDLKAMAERYPWFTGAQLLRAAGERSHGDVLADETLRSASAHLPSRAALADLIADPGQRRPAPLRVVKTDPAPPPQPESRIEEPAAGPAPPAATEAQGEAPTAPPSAVVAEVPEPAAAPAGPDGEPSPTPEPEPAPAAQETPASNDPDAEFLDDVITKAALASAYDLTWQVSVATAAPAAEPHAQPSPATLPAPQAPEPVRVEAGGRLRFSEWLQAAEESAPAAPLMRVPGRPPTPESPLAAPRPVTESSPPGALDAKDLIDRFIRQEPSAIPPKPAFFTPQQAAKKSLDDTAGLVTETLARIYEQQGNMAKAIDAYRRLALKYPEKAAYFAALQKKLEEQPNP
ncbi:MAG: tetratricopeptide repeat protein [Flavobacteriales bacterium]|nr:MAG: tetratricopeptide repeat protein [Flavobacteriales bacterium]